MELVLSLFPGLDLLGTAFTAAGFSVVRGPDPLYNSRIENFGTDILGTPRMKTT